MGSGLILLAIVGAWLAVLVPMALRRYDTSNLVTVDKFHDAMRVLARRDGSTWVRADGDDEDQDDVGTGRVRGAAHALRARLSARKDRPRRSAAARRRRVLILLVAATVGSLLGVVLGPLWVLAPHLVVDLLLVAFVVHLRKSAVARAEREWRAAMAARGAAPAAGRAVPAARRAAEPPRRRAAAPAEPAARRRADEAARRPSPAAAAAPAAVAAPAAPVLRPPVHVAGIPDRMPPRLLPDGLPAGPVPPRTVPAARGAQGQAWSPVPVPPPIYLSAPVAPRPAAAAPAQNDADALSEAERELGIVDEGPQLEEILERRRAVNDW